jgi:hypothetical protein
MRAKLIGFILVAVCAAGQSGIEAPVMGQIRDGAGRLIRLSGAPGALQAEEMSGGEEWLEPGWWLDREGKGLTLVRESSGERYVLPMVASNLQLSVFVPPSQETPVTSTYAFPLTATGDSAEVRFRVRNTGTAIVEVNRVFIAPGGPFRVSNAFPIPRTMAPGGFGEIRVAFSPTTGGAFSGELKINDTVWTLTGVSQAVPELEVYDGQSWASVASGATLDFGRIQPGQQVDKWFRLTMPAAETPRVAGDGFTLDMFGEGFRITCRPAVPGQYSAKLALGARSWTLTATGEEPAPPTPMFVALPAAIENGVEHRVEIALASPATANVTGTLRLVFEPETAQLGDDATVAFLPSQSRSIGFSVKQGQAAPEFADGNAALIQTGSTAGWIVLRIILGPHIVEQRVHIAPAAVKIDAATAARSANVAEIVIKGIDNARTAQRIGFKFYRTDASVAGSFDIGVGPAFKDYYAANTKSGGVFQLRAQFPVSGDSTQLESVEITLTNETGARNTGRLKF